jgi:outer membrane biosynthesis protein TonB
VLTKKDIPLILSIIILCFIVAQLAVQASYNINDNVTPDDTVIVQPAKETPTPKPVTPTQPTVKETPTTKTITVTQPTTPPEDEYQKAKERQQQEQIEELNKQEPAEEPTEEQAPEPINVNAVVDQDGYVYVGVENAGRQVTITGV